MDKRTLISIDQYTDQIVKELADKFPRHKITAPLVRRTIIIFHALLYKAFIKYKRNKHIIKYRKNKETSCYYSYSLTIDQRDPIKHFNRNLLIEMWNPRTSLRTNAINIHKRRFITFAPARQRSQ